MRKIIEPVFIHFSKMYIYFYEDKRDYWRMFPSLILSFLFAINLEIISFYFIDIPRYYYLLVGVFFVIYFFILFKNIKYEYVKNYKMPTKTRVIISLLIVFDLIVIFVCLNILRNGKFMW